MGCLRAILIVFCILIILPFLLSACSMAIAIAFPPIGNAYADALHQFGFVDQVRGVSAMSMFGVSLLPMLFIALVIIALLRLLRDEPGQAKTPRRQRREPRSGRTRGPESEGEQFTRDETRMIQELHQGFSRMEERVESLETILIDAHRRRK
ncbi:MAG: hypothetical protein GY851_09720 [bacterium]|nr:hypothetical protein [bacterium]